jgi:hypothetical protein
MRSYACMQVCMGELVGVDILMLAYVSHRASASCTRFTYSKCLVLECWILRIICMGLWSIQRGDVWDVGRGQAWGPRATLQIIVDRRRFRCGKVISYLHECKLNGSSIGMYMYEVCLCGHACTDAYLY